MTSRLSGCEDLTGECSKLIYLVDVWMLMRLSLTVFMLFEWFIVAAICLDHDHPHTNHLIRCLLSGMATGTCCCCVVPDIHSIHGSGERPLLSGKELAAVEGPLPSGASQAYWHWLSISRMCVVATHADSHYQLTHCSTMLSTRRFPPLDPGNHLSIGASQFVNYKHLYPAGKTGRQKV